MPVLQMCTSPFPVPQEGMALAPTPEEAVRPQRCTADSGEAHGHQDSQMLPWSLT